MTGISGLLIINPLRGLCEIRHGICSHIIEGVLLTNRGLGESKTG